MNDVLYLDVVIFENIIMNYALLYSIRDYCNADAAYLRLLCGSLVGIMYLVITIIAGISFACNIVLKIIVSILMVWISFSIRSFRLLLKSLFFFYSSTFIMSGMIIAQCFFFNSDFTIDNNMYIFKDVKFTNLLIGAIATIFLVKLSFGCFINLSINRRRMVLLKVINNDNEVNLRAMVDTGNIIKDPWSNKSVIFAYYKDLKNILPNDLYSLLDKDDPGNLERKLNLEAEGRIRMLPYRSLGNDHGEIITMKVDEVHITLNVKRAKREPLKNIVIAIYDKNLSTDNEFNAIISPDLLNGG